MRRNTIPYIFLSLAALITAATLGLFLVRSCSLTKTPSPTPHVESTVETPVEVPPIKTLDEPTPSKSTEEVLPDLNTDFTSASPSELLNRIGKALENGDMKTVSQLIGEKALDTENLARLTTLATSGSFRVRNPGGIREIGELELNRLSRWALELVAHESVRSSIFFDLRNEGGKWRVDKLILPPAFDKALSKAIIADSLGVADTFLQAVLIQDFERARGFVDASTVSDTKIAALCILFEEGKYRMREVKPFRAMFNRGDTIGYLAHVVSTDGVQNAEFALHLRQRSVPTKWLVSEINLDGLLTDYANRIAGGDIYYSPLVKNPAGGETLALYFGFDEDVMNDRTRRQLDIIATMLRSDPDKKITLSGHTDALGTANYNNQLSSGRATTVRDFLVSAGVPAAQIQTIAKGASQPRRPNVTETGNDNPDGRRANRRTEIYLDF